MTPDGAEERRSIVRKIYLYFTLLVATITVLSSAVYIVFRLLSLLLGEPSKGNLFSSLGQAIAFTLIGVGVWMYHGSALRGDGRINRREQVSRLAEMHVAVVEMGEGSVGQAILEELRHEMPNLSFDLIALSSKASEVMGTPETVPAQLSGAGLIVLPWTIAFAGGVGGVDTTEIASEIVASPARKLLVPIRTEGWEWAGVDRWNAEALVKQTARAVKQWIEGEEVKAVRPMSVGAIIGIIVGILLLLILVAVPLLQYFSRGF
jgi:hypothetical protein